MHGGTTIHATRRFDAVDPIADRWDDLVDRLAAPPFLRPGWARAWLAAFAPEAQLSVSTVWRADDLVALTPLLIDDVATWTPTNDHTPLWGFLAIDADAGDALAADMVAHQPDRLVIELVDVDEPATRHVEAGLAHRRHRALIDDEVASPFTELIGPWQDFEQRLSRRRRSQLRRYARRLDDEGKVTLETHDGADDLDALLAEGFAVEAAGWKGAQGTAMRSDATTRRFYTDVARWAAARGDLCLDFLRLDDRPIAFQYRLVHGDTVWYLKAGYDEEHGRWSPSTRLLTATLREAVEDPATTRFEWLGGTERYKLEWSDGLHTRRSTTWYGPTFRGRAARVTRTAGRRAKGVIRDGLPESAVERLKDARRRVRDIAGGG
jgi:CelD/BcsL family acetyltransferase involved in cellulose biosynthesis